MIREHVTGIDPNLGYQRLSGGSEIEDLPELDLAK